VNGLRVDKADNAISRVKCVVNTCRYYKDGDHCTASKIEIQPPNASDTEQTDCATFAPK
jgi:hypothetical protein